MTPSIITIQDLLAETQLYLTPDEQEKIQCGYELAKLAHQGAVRRSGEPYIQHPLEVAYLLAGMRIDADGIVSALLHDVVEDTDYALDYIQTHFGSSVAKIVDGVTKFDALPDHNRPLTPEESSAPEYKRRLRIETVRKFLLAMAEEPRVVVLKLADRLHNMRTLKYMSPKQQQNIALETREIYAPLAKRMGMVRVQSELEDLAFRYLESERFQKLAHAIEEEVERRRSYVEEVCEILRDEMAHADIQAEVHAWQKHLASIQRKLDEAGSEDVSTIHDLVSFRILVKSDYECYLVLGHIHALWRPKDGRIKDFIAKPKQNGYQSLHTTVFCLDNHLAEIQIRTHEMQQAADYGIASYWYQKEFPNRQRLPDQRGVVPNSWQLSYREVLAWMEQLREWQREVPQSADEFVEAFKGDIFQEQIFVFTPKGEVKDLPRGSTPLDMAYRIHTDIGDHCAGARVTSSVGDSGRLVTRLVPLDYQLKGGEIVDIVVNQTVHPTRDWLSFARTAAARNRIRRYLKTYEREINLQLGWERLDLALKTAGHEGMNSDVEVLLRQGCSIHDASTKKYANLDDLFVAIGKDELKVEDALSEVFTSLPERKIEQGSGVDGCVQQGENLCFVRLASCCCPIPGDAIVGYPTPSEGMVVHRADCPNLSQLHQNTHHALVDVNWRQIQAETYFTSISIVAHDRSGLLRDVAAIVADAGINMTSVSTTTNASLHKATITAILEIADRDSVLEQIEKILRRLRQVNNVVSADRLQYVAE